MAAHSSLDATNAFRLMQAGRFEEALAAVERAAAGARICLPVHGVLAATLLKLGRAAEAEDVIVRTMELNAGIADAYDSLAYLSMALEKHDRANALYRRAMQTSMRRSLRPTCCVPSCASKRRRPTTSMHCRRGWRGRNATIARGYSWATLWRRSWTMSRVSTRHFAGSPRRPRRAARI